MNDEISCSYFSSIYLRQHDCDDNERKYTNNFRNLVHAITAFAKSEVWISSLNPICVKARVNFGMIDQIYLDDIMLQTYISCVIFGEKNERTFILYFESTEEFLF